MTDLPPPEVAWDPLPPAAWEATAVRHLLRRAGWTARPAEVERALTEGLDATLGRLFPAAFPLLPKPPAVAELEEMVPELTARLRNAPAEERNRLQKELRDRSASALQQLSLDWLNFAATPGQEAAAKWTQFLGDIYVVSQEKVRQTGLVFAHQDILLRQGLGRAPALTKAVTRSPAMIVYLDLQDSRRDAPNENFARELFELFTLGEGHYSEADIKEAARAFTGYRQRLGQVAVAGRQADHGSKTIFGKTGRFDGDDVVDLVYQQPAAATFLPGELVRTYLSDQPLPAGYVESLGAIWRKSGFDLRVLAHRFFGSQLFYAPAYRGNLIKSPLQFFVGLLQDLDLSVAPLPRQVLLPFRQMGQTLYQPPNVRGWVGGRSWINSSTLAARRQTVQTLFREFDESVLNADDRRALAAARAAGRTRFVVDDHVLGRWQSLPPDRFAAEAAAQFLAPAPPPTFARALTAFLRDPDTPAAERPRAALAALFQTPEYQLC